MKEEMFPLGYALSWRDLTENVLYQKWDKKGSCLDEKGRSLHTGDVGWLDKEGFLYITGRKSRFVKLRGYRFSLDELQEELSRRLHREVVCVNGWEKDADKIGVGCSVQVSGETKREESGERERDERKVIEQVEKYFYKKRIQRGEFSVGMLEEIPRRSNGKIDYQKTKEFFSWS